MNTAVWFSPEGAEHDLRSVLGRDDQDIRAFALHTLGWVQVQIRDHANARIAIELDLRVIETMTLHNLADFLFGNSLAPGQRLGTVLLKMHLSDNHQHEEFYATAVQAIKRIEEEAMTTQARVVASTVVTEELDIAKLNQLGTGLDTFAIPFKIWRLSGQHTHGLLFDRFTDLGLLFQRIKIVRREHNDEMILKHYGNGVLWSKDQEMTLLENPIRVMPDQTLGANVERACRNALEQRRALFERCSGIIVAHDGPRKCQWLRLTLPCKSGPKTSGEEPNTVITITETERSWQPVRSAS